MEKWKGNDDAIYSDDDDTHYNNADDDDFCVLMKKIILFFLIERMTNGYEPRNIEKRTARRSQTGKIAIIFFGSLISCVLVSFIFREIFTYRQLAAQLSKI